MFIHTYSARNVWNKTAVCGTTNASFSLKIPEWYRTNKADQRSINSPLYIYSPVQLRFITINDKSSQAHMRYLMCIKYKKSTIFTSSGVIHRLASIKTHAVLQREKPPRMIRTDKMHFYYLSALISNYTASRTWKAGRWEWMLLDTQLWLPAEHCC